MSSSRLIVAAAALLVSTTLPAQGITWGPALGLNLANLAGDDVTDTKMLMGFSGGVALDKSTAGKSLFWRTGAAFSMQGAKSEDAGPPASESKLKLNYINIPLLAGWKFTPTSATSPYLLVGPQLGINMGCDSEIESGGASASASCDDDVESMDFGAVIGAGMPFAMGASTIHIGATYTLGLTTTDNGDPAADMKNRVFALTFTYMMPSKRAVSTGN